MGHATSVLAHDSRHLAYKALKEVNAKKKTRRILLIEDNKADVLLVKRMLHDACESEDFTFTDVPRMIDALELLDENSYDLILLDLNLLDIEGTATIAALHAETPNTPIIVHSGANDPKLKEEALICGAKHYLVKGRESPYSMKFMIQNALIQVQL